MPYYYYLPKVHKDLSNPPGHPIISGVISLTSNLLPFIDHFLWNLVKTLPSYLKIFRRHIRETFEFTSEKGVVFSCHGCVSIIYKHTT